MRAYSTVLKRNRLITTPEWNWQALLVTDENWSEVSANSSAQGPRAVSVTERTAGMFRTGQPSLAASRMRGGRACNRRSDDQANGRFIDGTDDPF